MKNWDPLVLGPKTKRVDFARTRINPEHRSNKTKTRRRRSHKTRFRWLPESIYAEGRQTNKKLTGIGHAQVHGPFVLQIEIFVLEFASVDALVEWFSGERRKRSGWQERVSFRSCGVGQCVRSRERCGSEQCLGCFLVRSAAITAQHRNKTNRTSLLRDRCA